MAVSVSVRSYTHAVTYVTDNLLRSLKDVIRLSGLDPSKFASDWNTLHTGIRTWIESGLGTGGWTQTNPRVHADRAVDAQKAYSSEWKGLVRMMKYWNNHHDKPIKPSFLIEVMALEILHPPYGGRRDREMQGFFATLAERLHETWPDPAGLGPPVSDAMDAARISNAVAALRAAEREAANAIDLSRRGKQGESLRAWRALFGPLFPLS